MRLSLHLLQPESELFLWRVVALRISFLPFVWLVRGLATIHFVASSFLTLSLVHPTIAFHTISLNLYELRNEAVHRFSREIV